MQITGSVQQDGRTFVFDPASGVKAYINGALTFSVSRICTGLFSTPAPQVLGLHSTYYDLMVVNSALTATQITSLYNTASPNFLPLCSTCPAGSYCPTPTAIPCPAGTYNQLTGQTDSAACLTCPARFYCASVGMTSPTSCPTGTYRDATGGQLHRVPRGDIPEPDQLHCMHCLPRQLNVFSWFICHAPVCMHR